MRSRPARPLLRTCCSLQQQEPQQRHQHRQAASSPLSRPGLLQLGRAAAQRQRVMLARAGPIWAAASSS
jgi:hypothetical protein